MLQIDLLDQSLYLHPFKAAYWQEGDALLLADLHLGKARHFRRSGIPVPADVGLVNWDKLISLLLEFKPGRVLILGDLFHSDYNEEWEELRRLVAQFHDVRFELVPGNHDILTKDLYRRSGLLLHPVEYVEGPFLFTHHPVEAASGLGYNLAGHLHPGVRLRGYGRQRMRLPCFYFGEFCGVLPAFGSFTGTSSIRARNGDRVYVVSGEEVLEV